MNARFVCVVMEVRLSMFYARTRLVLVLPLVFAACADAGSGTLQNGTADGAVGSDITPGGDGSADTGPLPSFDVPRKPIPRSDAATPHDDVPMIGDGVTAGDGGRVCAMNEVCGNGVDDNCNGMVDERCACVPGTTQRCFDGPPATAGVGACAFGMQRCEGIGEFGTWSACTGATLPASERCDSVDNDCDGRVDNGCDCRADDTRSCYSGPIGTRGVGACRDGMQTCTLGAGGVGSAWGMCAGETLPMMERCDGIDNDCNGTVDDGCACRPGEMRACYGGPMGTMGVGRCRGGTQTCTVTGGSPTWGTCTGQELPAGELCDGIDNNCDGVIDDGCVCRTGETRPCYTGPMATRGVGTCAAGTQTCVAGADGVGSTWGACTGERLPAAETCDDMDNNCDGAVDESCTCRRGATQACYTGPMATRGVGACRPGTQGCVIASGVATWGPCAMEVLPSPELCDGIDNNCNGTVDDGCACRTGATQSCYTGPMGTASVGICRNGTQTCVAGASGVGSTWGECTGQTLPAVELCDGIDNNCNGTLDEGCACRPGATQSCYTGPMGTANVGACRNGTQTCIAGAGGVGSAWGTCTGQTLPGTESCNAIDDDCDGMIDEGCTCTVGATRSCYGGAPGTAGVGACRNGMQTCTLVGGVAAWGACGGDVLPSAELCDGIDNDCNGVVDNGCACRPGATQMCYSGPAGTAGVGVCRAGMQSCVAGAGGVGSSWGTCSGERTPASELCDLNDNDCDGVVDEGCACMIGATQSCYTGPAGTAGVGVCRAGTQSCVPGPGGMGSAWGPCNAQVLPSAEVCDMNDNNCNGAIDDGLMCSGPSVMCPAAVTALAGDVVTLRATAMGATSYRWSIVSAPPGSAAMFGSPTSSTTTFTSVIVGVYSVRLTVTDAMGRTATCMTTITLQGHGLRVELSWNTGVTTPSAPGRTDIDLHVHNRLATAWFTTPDDCYFLNGNPNWDSPGPADNPSLDVDNVYGFGPENIRVDAPVVGTQTYSIGVHNYTGSARTTATVRVYCGTTLAATYTRVITGSDTPADPRSDFWRVARVVFTSPSACTVTPIDDVVTLMQARMGRP